MSWVINIYSLADDEIVIFKYEIDQISFSDHIATFSQGPLQIEIIVKKSNRKTSVTLDISGWRGFNTQNSRATKLLEELYLSRSLKVLESQKLSSTILAAAAREPVTHRRTHKSKLYCHF